VDTPSLETPFTVPHHRIPPTFPLCISFTNTCIHHHLPPCPSQCTGHPPLFMHPFLPSPRLLFLCYLVYNTLLFILQPSRSTTLVFRSSRTIVGLKSILIDLSDHLHPLFLSTNPLLSIRIYATLPSRLPSRSYTLPPFYFFSLPFAVCPIRPSP